MKSWKKHIELLRAFWQAAFTADRQTALELVESASFTKYLPILPVDSD